MVTTIILLSIAGLIYANFGIKIGIDVGKDVLRKLKESHPENKDPEFPALLVGLLAGAIWPLLILSVTSKRKNKMLQETATKALPASKNSDSPVDIAEAVLALEGKRAQLEQDVSQLAQQIEELKADPEVSKVLKFPKRF